MILNTTSSVAALTLSYSIKFAQMFSNSYNIFIIKAFRAFMEMRQEADVTSKLDHPCIVSFVGISIRPDLLMCLELAPLGSLRRVLDKEIEGREPFNKYRDKEKVFPPVFSKEINFKLVHQVKFINICMYTLYIKAY